MVSIFLKCNGKIMSRKRNWKKCLGQRVEGTNTFHAIKFEKIPMNRVKEICYTSVVCEVRPGKKDPNRTRITIVEQLSATQGMQAPTQHPWNYSNLRSIVYYPEQEQSMCASTQKPSTTSHHLLDQNMSKSKYQKFLKNIQMNIISPICTQRLVMF